MINTPEPVKLEEYRVYGVVVYYVVVGEPNVTPNLLVDIRVENRVLDRVSFIRL